MNQLGPVDYRFIAVAGVSLVLNIVAWGTALFFPRDEAAAVLHYTSTVGIDFVGEGRHIIVLPAAGLVIFILNIVVGRIVLEADKRTAWVLWSAVPIIQSIICIALIFLMSINQ